MTSAPNNPPSSVVSLRNVSKTYGARRVVDGISLDFLPGQVHALLGQNGSGKSTLIKIMTGVIEPDHHADPSNVPYMLVHGVRRELPVMASAASADGITAVHQDLPIIGSASVLENLQIGRYRTGLGWKIDWRMERKRVSRALEAFGIQADPDQMVQELSAADRAMLAILRGLRGLPDHRSGLLILDEPTAHLPRDGVDRVTAAIRKVAHDGHAVVLVTHRLDEVFAISHCVSVIRDGEIRLRAETRSISQEALIEEIIGFELKDLYPAKSEHRGDELLLATGLTGETVRDFSIALRAGEIVGLTGLIGAGHEEVPHLLFGSKRARSGQIKIAASTYSQHQLSPKRSMRLGMALLPDDRREASGIGSLTVRENVTIPILDRFFRRGLLHRSQERAYVREKLIQFGVNPPEPELLLGGLSGGNQQKALLAKWLQTRPPVLILHEPTQGVDIGARRMIFQLIKEAAAQGSAVLIVSSEYADLANLCDRVFVMSRGYQAGELSAPTLSEQQILALCMVKSAPPFKTHITTS
jgi:ribose transport system ATP-binding protein